MKRVIVLAALIVTVQANAEGGFAQQAGREMLEKAANVGIHVANVTFHIALDHADELQAGLEMLKKVANVGIHVVNATFHITVDHTDDLLEDRIPHKETRKNVAHCVASAVVGSTAGFGLGMAIAKASVRVAAVVGIAGYLALQ
ncbi:MAG: hypothetical protein V4534_05295 [Myxococcota bacterium]